MAAPQPNWTPRQVIENWFQTVWNEKTRDAIFDLFVGKAGGLDPAGGAELDPEAYAAQWDEFQRTLDNIHIAVVDVVEDGPRGAVRFKVNATHKATGKPVTFEGAGFFVVVEGRIQDAWNAIDFLGMATQISDDIPADVLPRVLSGTSLLQA